MKKHTTEHRFAPVLLFLVLLSGCAGKPRVHEFQGSTMGTFFQVKVVTAARVDGEALKAEIGERLETVNRLMSNWKDDSDVSRFNAAPTGQAVTLDPHTARVVARALQVAADTGGAFDPTLSPLIDLWGFGSRDNGQSFPDDARIAEAAARVGYHKLALDGTRLTKLADGVSLNLSALAKGYAVDLVYDTLVARGYTDFLVNVGGDGRVRGRNGAGNPWRMGIEAPDSARLQGIYTITEISDTAMATSGDYRIFFERDGVRYSHLIDPRTSRPIPSHVTSVTIIAPDCMTADAYATALSILTPDEGLALVERSPGLECFLILRDADDRLSERMSSGMGAYMAHP